MNSLKKQKEYIEIIFTDEKDQEEKLIGYIGEEIKNEETREITASIDKDLTKSTKIKYSIIK